MRSTEGIAVVAVFSSVIVGSDFALTPLVNVKLLDTLVFVVAFVFGFRMGALVAVLSETVWSVVSPWGMGGAITLFLIVGELLFAFAGYSAAKIWGGPGLRTFALENTFFGALLTVCAFVWDFETNIATGLLAGANTVGSLMVYEMYGIPFMIPHELSDFALGAALAPAVIVYSSRLLGRRGTWSPAATASRALRVGSKAN